MTQAQAVPQGTKLRLDNHAEYFKYLQLLHEPIECDGVADLSEQSQQVMQQVLESVCVAVAEAIDVGSDEAHSKSLPSHLVREEIQADRVWHEVLELEAAVAKEEALWQSALADAMSEVREGMRSIEQSGSLWEEIARSPTVHAPRDVSAAEHEVANTLRKQSTIQDELARACMYVKVAQSKAGDLADRRRSLLPPCLHGAPSVGGAVALE
jgi:hypothetical protein